MQYHLAMELLSLIRQKRGGGELSSESIHSMVQALVAGDIADYQLSALLMAICYEGLSYRETFDLTMAYVNSGATLRWPDMGGPVVDKHSTGGVGDKVSLLLAPWLAAMGLFVPKMSGRGLGHTGGTIDKLESIPGFNVELTQPQMNAVLASAGCAVVSQSGGLVPADKLTYALRDATGTVDELGLIAASVMSKKIAAGAQFIVLDVKCGSGAFFQTGQDARAFARTAIRLGSDAGCSVACVISSMHQPLGHAAGNALEVSEVLDLLAGTAPVHDLQELCEVLGAALLMLIDRAAMPDETRSQPAVRDIRRHAAQMRLALHSGDVADRFKRWIAAQGGDLAAFNARQAAMDGCRKLDVTTGADGWIKAMDTRAIGEFVRSLGAGRLRKSDVIDPLVGIICRCKTGGALTPDSPLASIIAKNSDPRSDEELRQAYLATLTFTQTPPPEIKLIHAVMGNGWELDY